MPTPKMPTCRPDATLQEVKDYMIGLNRYMHYLLTSLDTLNISRLDAKVIIAGSITALQIAANTITADKMDVTELSAISANLGTITAGIIYGAYIATANGTYPRIEFSATDNLLTAYISATDYVSINPDYTGSPSLDFNNGAGNRVVFGNRGSFFILDALQGDVMIRSQTGDLNLDAATGAGFHVTLTSWSALYNITSSHTLQTDLNNMIANTAAAQADATSALSGLTGKQNSFTGFTGTQNIVESVNFGASTTVTKTLHFTNGVLTSIT